jgi:multiple sugar transport system permease protein
VQNATVAVARPALDAAPREPGIRLLTVLKYVVLVVALIIVIFPLYWLAITGFKFQKEIFSTSPTIFPSEPTFENYTSLFAKRNVAQFLLNSTIVVSFSVGLGLAIGSLAAYSLARFRLWMGVENRLAFLILSTRMIPAIVIVVPIFLMIRDIGLVNTYWGLGLVYMSFNLPWVIWMMRSFFAEIPVDLEEAAMVDGDSRLTAFIRIVLPLAAPGLAATAIFAVITTWNEFLIALILTSTESAMTMPVGAATLSGKNTIAPGEMAAIATIAVIPVMVFALFVQRHLVRGLTMGAVK